MVHTAQERGGVQRGPVLHPAGGGVRGARILSHPDDQRTLWMYLRHLRQRGESRER